MLSDSAHMPLNACPYCNALLPKPPQRKTKCPACGQVMLVRSTPDDRTRRPMTLDQAAAAQAKWALLQREAHAARISAEDQFFGGAANDQPLPAPLPDVQEAVRLAAAMYREHGGHRQHLVGRARSARNPTEVMAANLAVMHAEVLAMRHLALRIQTRCKVPGDCEPCRQMHLRDFDIDAPLFHLLPRECPALRSGWGSARRLCNLSLSVWMERADGSTFIVRRPPSQTPLRKLHPAEMEAARRAWSGFLNIDLPQRDASAAEGPAPAPEDPK